MRLFLFPNKRMHAKIKYAIVRNCWSDQWNIFSYDLPKSLQKTTYIIKSIQIISIF